MMKKFLLVAAIALFLGFGELSAANLDYIKNKLGALNYNHVGGKYTLSTSTTTLDSAATPLSGTTLFYERMLTGRFGLGLTFSSFLERSFQLTIGTDIYDILETVTAMSFDFKTYFSEHKKEGWKTYMGVSFGQYTVASTIVKTDSNGATTDGKTGATVPTTSLSFGVDYVLEFGGFRMDTAIINGKRYDKTGFDLHDAVYDYSTTTVVELGVFSFF